MKKTGTKQKPTKKLEPIKKIAPKKEPSQKKPEVKQPNKPAKTKQEKPKVDPQIEAARAKAQKEAQDKQKNLIAAAQESIAKIDQGRAKMIATKSGFSGVAVAPAAITSLQIDALPEGDAAPLSPGEKSYRDELASRLKLMLKLPEHGDVQLKLTLNRTGKALNIVILKSASIVNRSYVEKTLPGLKFPPFGNQFENMSEYTFIIQLSNEL